MIKKIFNRSKKTKADFETLSLSTLKKGCMLDYFMETWVVNECYEYDWGNNFFSKEYLLDSGAEKIYLHVENDEELSLSISRSVEISEISEDLKGHIIKLDEPPKEISFKGKKYRMSDSNQGYQRIMDSENWSEFVSWEFMSEDKEEFIGIMRWGETDIEASTGVYTKEFEFTNLLPSNT